MQISLFNLNGYRIIASVFAGAVLLWANPVSAALLSDPFGTESDLPGPGLPVGCDVPETLDPLTFMEAIRIALCRNPDTQSAWGMALANASSLGAAQSTYLPTINAGASATRAHSDDGRGAQTATTSFPSAARSGTNSSYGGELTLDYLLYDFGGREAEVESARQSMLEAGWLANSVMQNLVFQVVRAYAGVFSAEESLAAAREAETASEEAYKAAKARLDVGVVTPADTAQAETSLAQSKLDREQAENAYNIAKGTFAVLLHLPPTADFSLAPVDPVSQFDLQEKPLEELIDTALASRPDLLASRAREAQAKAELDKARAQDYPAIGVSGTTSSTEYTSGYDGSRTDSSITLRMSVPLFTGFGNTYRKETARHTFEAASADRAGKEDEVSLDVWNSYQNYKTSRQTYATADSLVTSAKASEALTLGRYKAGKGTLIDALNAQAKLADARRQWVSARYNILVTRLDLVRALGSQEILSPGRWRETSPAPTDSKEVPAKGKSTEGGKI